MSRTSRPSRPARARRRGRFGWPAAAATSSRSRSPRRAGCYKTLTVGPQTGKNLQTWMGRGNQLARQWRLLQLIDRPAGVTVEDAARALDCHIRTIWRDLDVLARAGFPIYDDKAGDGHRTVWRVTEEFRRRLPLKLGLAEVVALLMSRDLLAAARASVLGPDLASRVDKIRGLLSPDALRLLDTMRESVGVRAAGAKLQAPPPEVLAQIQP